MIGKPNQCRWSLPLAGLFLLLATASPLLAQVLGPGEPPPEPPALTAPADIIPPATQAPAAQTPETVVPARIQSPALTLTAKELEVLVAGVAFYRDEILDNVLDAARHPIAVHQAAVMRKTGEKGPLADVLNGDLPPSVQFLQKYPEVLTDLDKNLPATARLGLAMKTQTDDVIAAIRTVRAQAAAATNPTQGGPVLQPPAADGTPVYVNNNYYGSGYDSPYGYGYGGYGSGGYGYGGYGGYGYGAASALWAATRLTLGILFLTNYPHYGYGYSPYYPYFGAYPYYAFANSYRYSSPYISQAYNQYFYNTWRGVTGTTNAGTTTATYPSGATATQINTATQATGPRGGTLNGTGTTTTVTGPYGHGGAYAANRNATITGPNGGTGTVNTTQGGIGFNNGTTAAGAHAGTTTVTGPNGNSATASHAAIAGKTTTGNTTPAARPEPRPSPRRTAQWPMRRGPSPARRRGTATRRLTSRMLKGRSTPTRASTPRATAPARPPSRKTPTARLRSTVRCSRRPRA